MSVICHRSPDKKTSEAEVFLNNMADFRFGFASCCLKQEKNQMIWQIRFWNGPISFSEISYEHDIDFLFENL